MFSSCFGDVIQLGSVDLIVSFLKHSLFSQILPVKSKLHLWAGPFDHWPFHNQPLARKRHWSPSSWCTVTMTPVSHFLFDTICSQFTPSSRPQCRGQTVWIRLSQPPPSSHLLSQWIHDKHTDKSRIMSSKPAVVGSPMEMC